MVFIPAVKRHYFLFGLFSFFYYSHSFVEVKLENRVIKLTFKIKKLLPKLFSKNKFTDWMSGKRSEIKLWRNIAETSIHFRQHFVLEYSA